jgi:hypothetical protein
MRQRRLISTGAAGLLCGLAALATLALGAPKNPPNGPPADVPRGNGQVEIGLSKDSNVLNFDNAAIGDHTNGSVVVSNAGKLAADFALTGAITAPQSASALTDQLQLAVSKGNTPLYSGSVSGFNAAGSLPLGTLYPKQGSRTPKNVTLNFQLSFPTTGGDAADNALQNLGPIDQRLRIDATQHTGAQSNGPGNGNGTNGNGTGTGSNPKQNVAGESELRATGVATGVAPAGLTLPGPAAEIAIGGAGGSDFSDKKDGSPADKQTSNATAGSGSYATPEGTAGQPDDDLQKALLILGLFGCVAALVYWWSVRTPGGAGA